MEITEKINALPDDGMMWRSGELIVTTDELKSLVTLIEQQSAVIEEAEKALEESGIKFELASDVHRKMTEPRGVTNQTVHACEMCEALNELYGVLAAALSRIRQLKEKTDDR